MSSERLTEWTPGRRVRVERAPLRDHRGEVVAGPGQIGTVVEVRRSGAPGRLWLRLDFDGREICVEVGEMPAIRPCSGSYFDALWRAGTPSFELLPDAQQGLPLEPRR